MTKFIAILRGINVGGRRKLPMNELRKLFEELGFSEVQTYIQSGNVIFLSESSEKEISEVVEKAIFERYNFRVPVICRSAEDLQQSIAENPFFQKPSKEIERLHLTFLKELPEKEQLQKLARYDFSPDKFEVKGKDVFLYCCAGYSKTKLSNSFFENKLQVPATTRNWKTVLRLQALTQHSS